MRRVDNAARVSPCFEPLRTGRLQHREHQLEMPKYCSVPNCMRDSERESDEDRRSYFKFPLQEKARLQQWLENMGREDWTPSRHQYICHKHFAPSCFKLRRGIRYLDSAAVPTVFWEAMKRKTTDHSETRPKRLRADSVELTTVSDDTSVALDAVAVGNSLCMTHLCEILVDPSLQGETSHAEIREFREFDCSLHMGTNFPFTLLSDISNCGEGTALVVMSEGPSGESQDELVKGITADILAQGHGLVMNDSRHDCTDEIVASFHVEDVTCSTEEFSNIMEVPESSVIVYFETIPTIFPSGISTSFTFSADTILSSALSSKPISSTLPIVSKNVPPTHMPLVLPVEKLDTDEAECDDSQSEVDSIEQQDYKLEEHCYHKSSLSKEQLEAIVIVLQKKVKLLQQRDGRHLEKLLSLENTVCQLRQTNLMNEERLQLLERAYMQTGTSDAGETVAIIYEDDNAAYLYTPMSNHDEKLWGATDHAHYI